MYATPVVEGNTVVPTRHPPGSMTKRARFGKSPRASRSRKTSGRAPSMRTKTARMWLASIGRPPRPPGGPLPTQAQWFAEDDRREDRGGQGDDHYRRPDRVAWSWYPQGTLERRGVRPTPIGRCAQCLAQRPSQPARDAGPVSRFRLHAQCPAPPTDRFVEKGCDGVNIGSRRLRSGGAHRCQDRSSLLEHDRIRANVAVPYPARVRRLDG